MTYIEIDNTVPENTPDVIRELISNLGPIAARLSADDPESDDGWTVLNAALSLRKFLALLENTDNRGIEK